MDSMYFNLKISKLYKDVESKNSEILGAFNTIKKAEELIENDVFNFRKFMEMDKSYQYFLLNVLGKGLNIPETIKLINSYYKMFDSKNVLLLKSINFKEKELRINQLNELFIKTYNKYNLECRDVRIKLDNLNLILNLLKQNIDDGVLDLNSTKLLSMIEELELTENEKTSLTFIIFENISRFLEEKMRIKKEEEVKKLEENNRKLYEMSVKKNTVSRRVPGIKTRALDLINNVINSSEEIKTLLSSNGLLIDSIDMVIFEYLTEQGANLKLINSEAIKEYISKLVDEEKKINQKNKYKDYILNNNNIKKFVNNYFEDFNYEEFIDYCVTNSMILDENELLELLKNRLIKKIRNKKLQIEDNLKYASLILDNKEKRVIVPKDIFIKTKEELLDENISVLNIKEANKTLEVLFDEIVDNLDILIKNDLDDDEYQKYSDLIKKMFYFDNIFKCSYSDNEMVDMIKEGFLPVVTTEIISMLDEYKKSIKQEDDYTIDTFDESFNPKNMLFLDSDILDYVKKDFGTSNYYPKNIGDMLKRIDEYGIKGSNIKISNYHNKYGKEEKHLKSLDIKKAKKDDIRIFLKEIPKSDEKNRYIIVFIKKKEARNLDERQDALEAIRFLSDKEDRLKELTEIVNNDELFELELEKQKDLVNEINKYIESVKRKGL